MVLFMERDLLKCDVVLFMERDLLKCDVWINCGLLIFMVVPSINPEDKVSLIYK